MKDVVNPGECWQDWDRNVYMVHIIAREESTGDDHVVYQRMEPSGAVYGQVLVRPIREWLDVLRVGNGAFHRFTRVVDAPVQ